MDNTKPHTGISISILERSIVPHLKIKGTHRLIITSDNINDVFEIDDLLTIDVIQIALQKNKLNIAEITEGSANQQRDSKMNFYLYMYQIDLIAKDFKTS